MCTKQLQRAKNEAQISIPVLLQVKDLMSVLLLSRSSQSSVFTLQALQGSYQDKC